MAVTTCGQLRWAVETNALKPSPLEFNVLLEALPSREQAEVLAFKHVEDRNRALVGRIMQRAAVCGLFLRDSPLQTPCILRTKGRKPFVKLSDNGNPEWAANFNFNVSHEGNYTVLAAEPLLLVGVDVAAPYHIRDARAASKPFSEILPAYQPCFAASEWGTLMAAPPGRQQTVFQQLWSLKEAYIKARGDGLGFGSLSRAGFKLYDCHLNGLAAELELDGVTQNNWTFHLYELPGQHVASVALGPPSAAVDAYAVFKSTMKLPELQPVDLGEILAPRFEMLTIVDVLRKAGSGSVGLLESYLNATAEVQRDSVKQGTVIC